MSASLAVIVLLPFLLAWVPVAFARVGRNASAWSAGCIMAAGLLLLGWAGKDVFAGQTLRYAVAWLPGIGLDFSLRLDGLGWLFSLLILGIGLLVVLYARYYLSEDDSIGRFYSYLLLFAGAMLGVVLSNNLLLMVIFWEITSLTSFLLIGYWRHRSDAREGARMALAITGAGGLCLLAGVLLLGKVAGSFEFSEILGQKDVIQSSPLYLPILVLILLGAFTKSAQFPFHFWLPHAMAAPTPASAYLHSATMVKAGVFLLARFYPVLAGTDPWFYIVTSAGLVTFAFGAYTALFKHDIKGLLAYSTISHLGLITLLFGLQTPLSVVAAVFHIMNHAVFKASLFMAAGIIDHETGSRDMRKLNGLWKYMPYTGTLAMVAAASMAGVPLFNGFLSKEMFLAETLAIQQHGLWDVLVPVAALIASVFSVAYSVRFVDDIFFNGELQGLDRTPHEPPRWMKIPADVLVLICLVVGVAPAHTIAPLLAVAAQSALGGALPAYSLAIWHGFNLPLLFSMVALAGGVLVYFWLQHFLNLHRHVHSRITGHWLFHESLERLMRCSARISFGMQNGSLQRYLALIILVALVLGSWPFFQFGFVVGDQPQDGVNGIALVAWGILVTASIATVALHRQRFVALIMISTVGLVPSLIFVYFAAPDLALTQVSVEVVTIVLLLLALQRLPQHTPVESGTGRRLRDLALALAAGTGMTAICYAVLTRPFQSLSGYYLENSLSLGGGSNVVNVILVDFRGFDTFGEIIVLAIAALGIVAMLQGSRSRARPIQPVSPDGHPMMLTVLVGMLLPLALAIAVYIFLRGHNLPGGGFVGGLITGIALILLHIANGSAWTGARLRIAFAPVIGVGVLLAGLTGIGSWFFGKPFLTSSYGHPKLPVLGELPLASAAAFDLGVFLTVVGAVMLMLGKLIQSGSDSDHDNVNTSGDHARGVK